ncbi:MAG: hypothetical protein TE42_07860 [Candidatus Synechococcus spongiarum SP3]|uniref:Uncharacterized protein n=1 Tax=Candidatus Synechococcus spongiarum SP3 TaxID=1604020 RepID=A0A0G2IVV0_9SYNE|nr:MAG: hypothetical protein TE42_07860 [Candidatus Synechococcus spongiarum SP3]
MVLRLATTRAAIRRMNLAGFQFLDELLSVGEGTFKSGEVPLNFCPRNCGLELSIQSDCHRCCSDKF